MQMLKILEKLSEKADSVTFQRLTGQVRRMKAIPENGKRWKKNEIPQAAEITYLGSYEDAMELCSNESENIAFIVWVPRKEFLELISK